MGRPGPDKRRFAPAEKPGQTDLPTRHRTLPEAPDLGADSSVPGLSADTRLWSRQVPYARLKIESLSVPVLSENDSCPMPMLRRMLR